VANNPTSPLDATGRAAEQAAKKNAAEIRKRQDEMAISRAAEEELLETAVFDPKKPDTPIMIDEIEEVGVAVNNEKVVIRVLHDIEDMTYGVGNTYTFKANVKYSVPKDLADYLENLGYIWRAN
jgi:ferritin-like protein